MAKKIELVRETSSPILKVIKFAKIMEEITCLNSDSGEIAAADESLPLIFYLLVTMKVKKNAYLGARFIEECTYVTDFCQDEQLIIQEFCNFMHMETALDLLQSGEKPCYEAFLMPEGMEEDPYLEEKAESTKRGVSVRESI